MDESLVEGPDAFTLQRIQKQLQLDTFLRGPEEDSPMPLTYSRFEYIKENGRHRFYTQEEQKAHHVKFCGELYNQVQDLDASAPDIDCIFSQIIDCKFQPTDTLEEISDRTSHLLTRLPARPIELPDVAVLDSRDSESNMTGGGSVVRPAISWHQLQVTSYVSAIVIRAAILSIVYPYVANSLLRKVLDGTADLITTASTSYSIAVSLHEKQKWFIVRAFLWTAWQRCTMIYFYCLFGSNLKSGFSDHDGHEVVLRGMIVSPDLSIQTMSLDYANLAKPHYMCGWAFELLRSNPVCIGLDFRRFYLRFSTAFGERAGRCKANDETSCAGDEPDKCQRFRGMRIENQSLHDLTCPGDCRLLTWDEESYRSVDGARAVALDAPQLDDQLSYCEASTDTLAISHVWSHGQGGRPEPGHGLNLCLHRRYVYLARLLGCDSYWMDTACIPNDHQLRDEAIDKINDVFEHSKATLVCDKDLMDIDASDLSSIEVRETILATVIVCDWNVRAWTFLEAFRGRYHIHLLCRNNVVVSLRETVEMVYRQGNIDIALLLLTVPHLLPSRAKRGMRDTKGAPFVSGFLTVETAGSLLSHRAASRPGDDVVIWSLLLGDAPLKSAKALWKSRMGSTVATSFLISSAPRLQDQGLRWAPASPNAETTRIRTAGPTSRLITFDGSESEPGLIKKEGFQARWLMFVFTGPRSVALRTWIAPQRSYCANLEEIRRRYLKGYLWGALLRPVNSRGTWHEPAPNRVDLNKVFLIVCATNKRWSWAWEKDDPIRWNWRGLYEWDMAEPLPTFEFSKDILLV